MKNKWKAVLVALAGAIAAYFAPKPLPVPSPTPTPTATVPASPEPSVSPDPPNQTPTPLPEDCFTPRGSCEDKHGGPFPYQEALTAMQAQAEMSFLVDNVLTDEEGYVAEVVRLLRLNGVCAVTRPENRDEVWILHGPGLSSHVDIVAGPEGAKVPWQMLSATCKPAIVGVN